MLKRLILLVAVLCVLANASAMAQETGPLVMRIEFEWTVIGALAGVGVGALLWLTDPANPSNNLADSVAGGAAWGALLGAGFGVVVLQRSLIPPVAQTDPLRPKNRISTDPVAQASGQQHLLALRTDPGLQGPGLSVPLVKLRF